MLPFWLASRASPEFGRSFAHAVADVVAMDDEHVAAIASAAHDQMDVRIVGCSAINSDPVHPRSDVVLHLLDEVTRKGSISVPSSGLTMNRK